MRDFPSCFGENGIQVADSSSSIPSKTGQNLVTCVYQSKSRGRLWSITVTWTKNFIMGQGLSIGIDDHSTHQSQCKVDIKPWLFSKRKGSKTLDLDPNTKADMFWDFTCAKFGNGPEPIHGFYLALMFNGDLVLLLGDLKREAYKKIDRSDPISFSDSAIFVAKKEHIFGKKLYTAKTQFCDKGKTHDVAIECDTVGLSEPSLVIRIDSKQVMVVKRLRWKFRGNGTILVDGFPVDVYWDVHNWLFGTSIGNAVFMFQTSISASQSLFDHHSSFTRSQLLGFSLILYAWKND